MKKQFEKFTIKKGHGLFEALVLAPRKNGANEIMYQGTMNHALFVCAALNSYSAKWSTMDEFDCAVEATEIMKGGK